MDRVSAAAAFRSNVVSVECGPWQDTVETVARLGYSAKDIFFYVDPPFYRKAERLYRHYFESSEHIELHDWLLALRSHWLLSYDPAPEVVALYSDNGRTPRHVELLYSARAGASVEARELIISNLRRLPRRSKLFKSKQLASSGKTGAQVAD